jgi:hypothetical protein
MPPSTKNILAREIASKLEMTNKELFSIIDTLSDDQFKQHPFTGSWSTAQVIEHLWKADTRVISGLYGKVSDTTRNISQNISKVRDWFLNLSTKLDSPPSIIPSDEPGSRKELMESIRNTREKMMDAATTLDLTMTCHEAPPSFVEYTRLELLHFVLYHTQRHIHQLKNIRKHLSEKV